MASRKYLGLTLILLFAAFLRFYKIESMAPFDADQEYSAVFAWQVLREFPIRMIGQELSLGGLYLGPWYFYFLTPFYALFGLHPLGGAVGGAVLGLAIIAAYFFVGRDLFGTKAGLLAAFLRAILFRSIIQDWSATPVYPSELLTLLAWFFFYKYWKGNHTFLPLLFFSFGFYTSIHPVQWPLILVFATLLLFKRRLPGKKLTFLSIGAFLLPNIPLIAFEWFRKFSEVKRLFALLGTPAENPVVGLDRLAAHISFNVAEFSRILGTDFLPKPLFALIFFSIIGLLIYKKSGFWKESLHKYLLFLTYAIFLGVYFVYPGHFVEYYFLPLTTLAILYTAAVLSLAWKSPKAHIRLLAVLLLVSSASFNLGQLEERWGNPSLITLHHKDAIAKEIARRQPAGSRFFVSYISELGWNFGFDYLFRFYGRLPGKDVGPPTYTVVIPKTLAPEAVDISSGNIGLILPD